MHRKVDFELVLFAYFLGSMTALESLPPTALDQGAISPEERKTAPSDSSDRPSAKSALRGSKARAEIPRS